MNLLGSTHFYVFKKEKKKRKELRSISFFRVSGQEKLETPQSTILIIVSWDTIWLKIS